MPLQNREGEISSASILQPPLADTVFILNEIILKLIKFVQYMLPPTSVHLI